MGDRRRPRPLAWRLSAAFVAVAVGAVALYAVVLVVLTDADVGAVGRQQAQAATAAIVSSAASAYTRAGGWHGADLNPTVELAAASGAHTAIFDSAGAPIISTFPGTVPTAGTHTTPIVVDHHSVGTVLVQFGAAGQPAAAQRLRHRLVVRAGVVAAIAALSALAVAVIVAGRISRPLRVLTLAVRSMEQGSRSVRVGPVTSSAELAALASGFDQMADTLDRQDQLRQALVADIAHELRTPIAILQATSESVIDGVHEPSMAVVTSMHEEVLRLGQRVEDLAALAAADTAGLRLTRAPIDLSQVAAAAATALEQTFATAQIALNLELTPVMVTGDQARLFQVISNLLINAAKFTPPGGAVGLNVGPDGTTAIVEVTDNGIGISPDHLDHLFERFWRNPSSDTPGSGIGLAIVAELVAAHGGTVAAHSLPGQGSVFTVRLPASNSTH